MRILLIDDSKPVHTVVKECLEKFGFTFHDAFDGTEAIEIVKDNEFDFVFLDWEMPVMNGPATFDKLKEAGVNCPIVMLTSKNSPADIAMMLEKGVSDYVMKPFTEDILIEKIESCAGVTLEARDAS